MTILKEISTSDQMSWDFPSHRLTFTSLSSIQLILWLIRSAAFLWS